MKSLEGFPVPDTYFIGGRDRREIVQRSWRDFDEIGDRSDLANSAATNGLTPYQTVVAASLIQTEAKLAEDAPLISAVIRNRLRDSMPLQIDSTLCYAKGGCPPVPNERRQGDRLAVQHVQGQSGLPPTPISSVTEAILRPRSHPADVPYKFYVLIDANGKHELRDDAGRARGERAEARRRRA